MRDITYRAKRKDNGEWIEGNLVWLKNWKDEPYECFIISHLAYLEYGEFDDTYTVNPETVGQYTGLTDKNGKKIFEGDIVKHYHDKKFPESYSKGYVFWDEEYLRWKRTSENVNCCIANYCIYEVIGNIHDNPELLEVK